MMFDVVLSRANVYFASLSNYRYSLSRAGTKSNSRGTQGLMWRYLIMSMVKLDQLKHFLEENYF